MTSIDEEEVQKLPEVLANLETYKEQLADVEKLLEDEPDNETYKETRDSLVELIKITEELRDSFPEYAEMAAQAAGAGASVSTPRTGLQALSYPGLVYDPPAITANLTDELKNQMRERQGLQAIQGVGTATWAIGLRVDAQFSEDGQFYPAKVIAAAPDYHFLVEFEGYGDKELVKVGEIRQLKSNMDAGYKPAQAPKRVRVEEQMEMPTEIPKHMLIKDDDDEKTKEKKRKLLKNFKKKMRFAEMDIAQKAKADNWKSFLAGKGSKGPGAKRESIFKTTEGGKVGVSGPGKGMTMPPAKKQRHDWSEGL